MPPWLRTGDHGGVTTADHTAPEATPATPRLYRRSQHRILGGVAGGIADHIGVSARSVRIVFVLLTLFGGVGVVLYGVFWIVTPPPGHPERIRATWLQWMLGAILAVVAIGVVAYTLPLGSLFVPSVLSDLRGGIDLAAGLGDAARALVAAIEVVAKPNLASGSACYDPDRHSLVVLAAGASSSARICPPRERHSLPHCGGDRTCADDRPLVDPAGLGAQSTAGGAHPVARASRDRRTSARLGAANARTHSAQLLIRRARWSGLPAGRSGTLRTLLYGTAPSSGQLAGRSSAAAAGRSRGRLRGLRSTSSWSVTRRPMTSSLPRWPCGARGAGERGRTRWRRDGVALSSSRDGAASASFVSDRGIRVRHGRGG